MTGEPEPRPAEKRVRDVMHRGVITCKPDTLLKEVVRILADTGVHAVIVAESGTEVEGVISHMDVVRLYGKNLLEYKASDVMTPLIYDISADATVSEAVEALLAHRIHRLVVTEEGHGRKVAVGVLSTTDIIREMRGQAWYW